MSELPSFVIQSHRKRGHSQSQSTMEKNLEMYLKGIFGLPLKKNNVNYLEKDILKSNYNKKSKFG